MKIRLIPVLLLCLVLWGCGAKQEPETVPPQPETTTEAIPETTVETIPETTQAAQPPVVTKDPTGEKLSPGGKTWFVAHAEGASIVTWEFLSPEGTAYSLTETMSLHPGLLLDAGQVDTVALENVPLSLLSLIHI